MKFRIKIMLCMVALMALLFGIGASLMIAISFQSSLEREQRTAQDSYQMLVRTLLILDGVDMWSDGTDVASSLQDLMEKAGTLWSTCQLTDGKETFYQKGNRQELLKNLADEVDESHYATACVSDENGNYYLQLSGVLNVGNDSLYLDMLYDITSVYEMRMEQKLVFYRIFSVMLLSCLVLAWLISRLLTGSLSKLSQAAKAYASGDLSYRSNVHTTDEIGMLAHEFDEMACQVEKSITDIKASLERQEAFMGSFAHELKTPMTSVIGYADLIRGEILTSEECVEAANYIFTEGKRLESLSGKLLSVFMVDQQEVAFVPCSPGDMIQELADHLRPVYQKFGIEIETDCEPGVCLLEVDLIQTLMQNLIDNARKAMDGAGKIELFCHMTEDGCVIGCRDNGRGIPKESLEHLTDAFYRVDKSRSRAQGGVGLGLTLCSKIIQIHHGTLQIDSQIGVGTTVTAELKGGLA
jgi:signal transduction histidine kinase